MSAVDQGLTAPGREKRRWPTKRPPGSHLAKPVVSTFRHASRRREMSLRSTLIFTPRPQNMKTEMDVMPVTDVPHDRDDVLDILEDLVEVAREEEESFRHAAEKVARPFIRNGLSHLRHRRSEFVRELEGLERIYGKTEVPNAGFMGGAFSRAWIGVHSEDSPRDDAGLLVEVERGEGSAYAAYQEALQRTGLPAGVREALQNHSAEILKARNSLHEWQRDCACN